MAKKPAEKSVTKSVNVARLVQPNFLTLTKSPANEVAFKVIRKDKDGGKTEVVVPKKVRHRSVQRMDATLMIAFPTGTSEDVINEMMQEFGISDYQISVDSEGVPSVRRADSTEPFPEKHVTINLRDGVKVLLAQGEAVASDENPTPNIAVVSFEFGKSFDEEAVKEWLTRHDIAEDAVKIVAGEDVTSVIRREVGEDVEVKRMEVGAGVSAVVVRDAVQDVPPSVVDVISENAYGSWGWGQLDFAASMADAEFCDVAEEGLYQLRRVLEQIMFYSYLPVAVRKELVVRATSQFAAYIGALLDALPARVMLSYRNDLKEKTMTQKDPKAAADDVKRTDGAAATDGTVKTDSTTAAPAATTEEDTITIKRADLATMIKDGIAAALKESGVQRSDGAAAAAAPAAGAAAAPAPAAAAPAASATEMATSFADALRSAVEPIATGMKAMADRLEKVEGQTTVRSDGGDGKQTEKNPDVFAGVFRNAPPPAKKD